MVKFQHAKLTAGEEARALILSWQFSLSSFHFLSFCLFFSSFFLPTFSIFTRSNAHTYTNRGGGGGAKRRGRAEKRQRAVCFTRFVDYRLMFDSTLSFSLKYDVIRSPY